MNLNETLNSDIQKNDLLGDDSDVDDEQPLKRQDEESKYGKVVSLANGYRWQQVQSQNSRQAIILGR